MPKRLSVILSIVLGMMTFLLGCSKANHETIAFVGDESGMKTCYEIYPEQYFPGPAAIPQELKEGRFPPDLVGEYEMIHPTYSGTYEYYEQASHQYKPYPSQTYATLSRRSMYIIIEEQVNGMAKIKFSFKKNDGFDYKDWYEQNAYIYGNVYSENESDFILCYENTEYAGSNANYFRGNIIKGVVDSDGIHDIQVWSIIKDRKYSGGEYQGLLQLYGYEHAVHNLAVRRK